jgi:hypothetical protein
VRLKTLLVILGCAVIASPAFASARRIAPASLIVHRGDLPGFKGATRHVLSTSSDASFAEVVLEAGKGAILRREGFQEGVLEVFGSNTDGIAASTGAVFRSARGAKELRKLEISEQLKERGAGKRFTVAAIPGSSGISETTQQPSGGGRSIASGVLFATGRCFLEVLAVLNSREANATPKRVHHTSVGAATTLYRRVKRLCA